MQSVTTFDIFRKGTGAILTTFVRDPRNDELVDVAAASTFDLVDITNDNTLLTETFTASGGPTYVAHSSTGVYQVQLNTNTYKGEYLMALRCVLSGEVINCNTFFKSVSARHFKYVAALRNQVDKACKPMSDYIENMDRESKAPIQLAFGYSDGHLIFYLERGIQYINAVPPYTSFTVDTFPFDQNGSILLDAATIAALEAQGIFSIDTDYDYSLGGNSFVIDHFTKLSSFIGELVERYNREIIPFKKQWLGKGVVLYQFLPGGVRDQRMLRSLPAGFWSRVFSGNM